MIKSSEWDEIYARELNDEGTVRLFLEGRLYGCNYQASSRLSAATYFAPHFGARIAKSYPGVERGITHIARIQEIVVVDSMAALIREVKRIRPKSWYKAKSRLLDPVRAWDWNEKKRSFAFLDTPQIAFSPPAQKDKLQKGKGWLSKRIFRFDQLLAARGAF